MEMQNVAEFYQEMGDLIKMERTRQGISQQLVAAKLELTRTSVMNIEKGRHRPSIHQLLQIANIFEINFVELIPYGSRNASDEQNEVSQTIDNAVFDQKSPGKGVRSVIQGFLSDQKK